MISSASSEGGRISLNADDLQFLSDDLEMTVATVDKVCMYIYMDRQIYI